VEDYSRAAGERHRGDRWLRQQPMFQLLVDRLEACPFGLALSFASFLAVELHLEGEVMLGREGGTQAVIPDTLAGCADGDGEAQHRERDLRHDHEGPDTPESHPGGPCLRPRQPASHLRPGGLDGGEETHQRRPASPSPRPWHRGRLKLASRQNGCSNWRTTACWYQIPYAPGDEYPNERGRTEAPAIRPGAVRRRAGAWHQALRKTSDSRIWCARTLSRNVR
jgi:hypothetical protein